jgi:hypothetical protein
MNQQRSHGLVRVSLFVLAAILITFFGVQYAQNPDSKKLDVILKAPQGSTEGRREALEILAGFNQPMVALQGVPTDQGSGPVRTEPPLKGKYRWRGTTVLSFTPQDSLPYSTPYKVIIPAGTRSLSGAVLDKEVSWSFETPRPVLMGTVPYYQQHFVELDHIVAFNFNQPMDPAKAQKFFKLTEDDRKGHKSDIPFTVR